MTSRAQSKSDVKWVGYECNTSLNTYASDMFFEVLRIYCCSTLNIKVSLFFFFSLWFSCTVQSPHHWIWPAIIFGEHKGIMFPFVVPSLTLKVISRCNFLLHFQSGFFHVMGPQVLLYISSSILQLLQDWLPCRDFSIL